MKVTIEKVNNGFILEASDECGEGVDVHVYTDLKWALIDIKDLMGESFSKHNRKNLVVGYMKGKNFESNAFSQEEKENMLYDYYDLIHSDNYLEWHNFDSNKDFPRNCHILIETNKENYYVLKNGNPKYFPSFHDDEENVRWTAFKKESVL